MALLPPVRTLLAAVLAPFCILPLVVASAVLNLLPEAWFYSLCGLLGRSMQALAVRTSVVADNVQKAFPDWDEPRRRLFIDGHYRSMGFVFLDMVRMLVLTRARLRRRVSWTPGSHERVQGSLRKGRGVLLACAHLSNWEMGLAFLGTSLPSVHSIAKRQTVLFAQWLIAFHRWRFGVSIFYPGNAFKTAVGVLRANHVLAFVLDQHTPGDRGVTVDFFGRPARTTPSLAKLARMTGAPVLPVGCYRNDDGRLEVAVLDPVECSPERHPSEKALAARGEAARGEDVRDTQAYTRAIERLVSRRPEQWLWAHRRWKA